MIDDSTFYKPRTSLQVPTLVALVVTASRV